MVPEVARMRELAFTGSYETDGAPFQMLDLGSSPAGSGSSFMSASSPFDHALEFSGCCSTETESSEDDEFVAGLAERMAHSMLDDGDDEDRKIEDFRTKPDSTNWMNIWANPPSVENPQQTEGKWASRQPTSRPGCLVHKAFSSEGQSPSVLPFTVEHRHWNNGRVSNEEMVPAGGPLAFGDNDLKSLNMVHPSRGDSWPFNLPSDIFPLPQQHSFANRSYLTQDYSSVPSFTSAGFSDRIREIQKQRDLHEACELFTTMPSKQETLAPPWTKHNRPYPHQKSMGNSKVGHHVKGGFQNHSKITAAAQARSIHPKAGGSGMRAVFLGGSGACKESSGTGVFLPLSANYQKRKPACSTVLLPSRIVQILNLQLDNLGCQPVGPPSHNVPSARTQFTNAMPQATRALQKSRQFSGKGLRSHEEQPFKTLPDCSRVHLPSVESVSKLPADWKY